MYACYLCSTKVVGAYVLVFERGGRGVGGFLGTDDNDADVRDPSTLYYRRLYLLNGQPTAIRTYAGSGTGSRNGAKGVPSRAVDLGSATDSNRRLRVERAKVWYLVKSSFFFFFYRSIFLDPELCITY